MSLALEAKRVEMSNTDEGDGTEHGSNCDVDVASKPRAVRPNGKERGEGGGSQLAGAIVSSEVEKK